MSDIATHPKSVHKPDARRRNISTGTVEGIDIKTVSEPNRIVTGYPTNLPRNPKK